MVDDHRARVGHGAGVGHLPANQRLQCAVGADCVGYDLARGGAVLGIDQVHVSGTGVDITELGRVGGNGSILCQGQLSTAVGVYEDTLRRIVGVAGLTFYKGLEKRPAGYQEKVDGRVADRKIGEVGAGGILHLLVGNQGKPARVAVDVEGRDVTANGGVIPWHIGFAVCLVYRCVRDG